MQLGFESMGEKRHSHLSAARMKRLCWGVQKEFQNIIISINALQKANYSCNYGNELWSGVSLSPSVKTVDSQLTLLLFILLGTVFVF